MGKAGRWLRSFLLGKRDKEKGRSRQTPLSIEAPAPTPAPKEKRRWSFQRAVTGGKSMNSDDSSASMQVRRLSESEVDRKRHAVIMATAKAAAADTAASDMARYAAMAVRPTTRGRTEHAVEEAAAVKIQSLFRSHLARKALSALKGLVKLQAMVRGHLVRKQTTAMLRSMQSLVMAQARARVQRIQMVEAAQASLHRQPANRRSSHDPQFKQSYETDSIEEDVKIVEIDHGELMRNSEGINRHSTRQRQRAKGDHGFPVYYNGVPEHYHQFSPAPSAVTDINPRGYGRQFDEFSSRTGMSSPQHLSAASIPDATQTSLEYPFPSYMANTESSRAKARSQSAPRQRCDSYERQSSRRRSAVAAAAERSNPRGFKMHRSFSRKSLTSEHQHPWSIKLDHSSMSIKDGECGSAITVLTNTNYTRPLVAYE